MDVQQQKNDSVYWTSSRLGHFFQANFFIAFLKELGNFKPFEVNFKKISTGRPVDELPRPRKQQKNSSTRRPVEILLDVQQKFYWTSSRADDLGQCFSVQKSLRLQKGNGKSTSKQTFKKSHCFLQLLMSAACLMHARLVIRPKNENLRMSSFCWPKYLRKCKLLCCILF